MTEQILACPYCGSDNISITTTWGKYFGTCDGCGANGPEANSYTDAILLWNAAANQLAAKDDEIAQLLGENSRLKRANESMVEEKHRHYIAWQAEIKKVAAGDKRQDELEAEIEKLNAEIQHLRTTINILTTSANAVIEQRDGLRNQRDEARRVARQLYATNKELIRTFVCNPIATWREVYENSERNGTTSRVDATEE